MTKKYKNGSQLYESVFEGANELTNNVASTLGPRGRNVILQAKDKVPIITKDGVTIAKFVSLEDPFNLQNIGGMPGGYLDLVKEAGKVLGDPSRISSLPQGIGSGFMNWLADNPREQQNIAVQAGMQGVPTWMRGYAAQGLEDLSNQWLVQNPQGNLLTNFVNQGMRF